MSGRIGRPRYPDVLTPAEWRVLEHVRDGRPNAEIAVRLGISVNTVRYHVSNMLAKLEVADRGELATWDGRPRKWFSWLPAVPLPSFGTGALGLDLLGRGAVIAVIATVAVVIAVILATGGGEAEPRTSVVAVTSDGDDEMTIFGIEPATGAPLPDAKPLVIEAGLPGFPGRLGPSLLYYYTPVDPAEQPGAPTVITLADGARLGLAPSGLKADTDGVARRWTLPATANPAFVFIQPPEETGDADTVYGQRSFLGAMPDELWAFDLNSDQATLLTTATQIAHLHQTATGRLFVLGRDPGIDFTAIGADGQSLDDYTAAYERYAESANDYVAEIDRDDGHEIARIELGGAIAALLATPDQERLYLFGAGDGDLAVVDLGTMSLERRSLPTGGPWPSVFQPVGTTVVPALSPNGRRLYLTGSELFPCGTDLDTRCPPRPLGLRVVDLETNELLLDIPEVNRVAPSPDGRWLITSRPGAEQGFELPGRTLTVIDAATFEVVAEIEMDEPFHMLTVSADSRFAYAASNGAGLGSSTIAVVDLDLLEVIAKHTHDETISMLVTMP